jgi:hypothetical protein
VAALVTIPVPRHKPEPPPPPPVVAPLEEAPAIEPDPGSVTIEQKSEDGDMPLQVERQVSIQQLLVKLNRIEKKLNEVQEDERAGKQQHTN